MSLLQRARDSGKCAPSLLLSDQQPADVDGFENGLLRALDSTGFQLRPETQALADFVPLLQKAEAVAGTEALDVNLKTSLLIHRRCVLLAVVGCTDPSRPSIARLLEEDYLSYVKKWLDDILSGSVGGVDLLLHLLANIASLPVTKSVVKSSGMGKLIGSLEKHSVCTENPNASVIKERIQLVKDCWSASVKARKSQEQAEKPTQSTDGPQSVSTEDKVTPKRATDPGQSCEPLPKKAKLTDEPKKSASSAFSSLLKKVSGSSSTASGSTSSSGQGLSAKANGTGQTQTKKVSKRVKWADHFGGNLSVAQTLEADDSADGAPAATGGEASSSWSDRKKRDRLREKELLASAKKAKLLDDDDDEVDGTVLIDRSTRIQPSVAWKMPLLLPEMPNVTKPELVSNEKALQDSRLQSVPAVRYANESDVPSSPYPLTDVEQALDMTSQSSAILASIPFFVPQESAPGPAPVALPSSLYADVASALQSVAQPEPPMQSLYAGATPEFLQSLGLPMFLIGQNVQALQTIANSPGLLGTLVDATGQYDQQRLLSLVQTLSASSGAQTHSQHTAPSIFGQTSNIYGQPTPTTTAPYGAPASYAAPASVGFRSKNDAGNLHVSGFGPSTTQNDIIQLFSPYVRVDEVFMKGTFAFVNTSDPVNAQIAREALTGTLLGGMPIRINPAQRKTPRESSAYGPPSNPAPTAIPGMAPSIPRVPPPPPQQSFSTTPLGASVPMQNVDDVRDDRGNPATKNLFVAGYGPTTTEQQLRELFSQHGEVIGVVSKGAFSFVNTARREHAVACRQALMGAFVNGGALRINFAKESGRLGTSFDLTYGKDTGPNARRVPANAHAGPPIPYGNPQPPPPFGAQPAYGGAANYYGHG